MNNEPRDYKKIPPDLWLVALDETELMKSCLNLTLEDGRNAADVITDVRHVVLVDLNEQTYICSTVPSIFYVHCYTSAGVLDDVSEEDNELIQNAVGEGEEDDYLDFNDIERIILAGGRDVYKVEVTDEDLEEARERAKGRGDRVRYELLDLFRERYQSNWVL